MRKQCFIPILILFTFLFLPLSVSAEEYPQEQELKQLLDYLPEEYASYFFNDEGALSLPTPDRLLSLSTAILKNALTEGVPRIKTTLSLVLFCSIFSLFESCLSDSKAKGILRSCVFLTGMLSIGQALTQVFALTEEHLNRLCGILTGILPILNGIHLSMGAVSSAALSSALLTILLSLIGEFSGGLLFPFQKVVFALDLTAILTENKGLSSFACSVKKILLFLIGGLSFFLLSCFALQNVVAARADTAALRAFRFTAGGLVPVVGSALSESSRILLSGLELLRATGGAVAVIAILFMLLSPLCTLFVCAISLSLAADLSATLENDLLKSLFSAARSTVNHLAAFMILCDLSVIIALAITLSQTVSII